MPMEGGGTDSGAAGDLFQRGPGAGFGDHRTRCGDQSVSIAARIGTTPTGLTGILGHRPAPRIVAGLPVCLTDAEDDVRTRIAEQFALATQVPEYRVTLDREGVAGPQDIAIVGTATRVRRALARLDDAGVTEFLAVPFGTAAEQDRTVELLAGLVGENR
jgi:hypothetical protein